MVEVELDWLETFLAVASRWSSSPEPTGDPLVVRALGVAR
jgi:hypothetical protein